MFATVPYGGAITNTSGNPLGGRQAFVKASAGFPAFVTTTINFGTMLSNRTIRVRFRIGTDDAVGTAGWTLDDIGFTGLTNTPFSTVSNDAGTCSPPVANAGPDQTVFVSSNVQLDGSASSDPNNDPLTYSWQQTSGPTVTLSSTTTVNPTFTAPAAPAVLVFQLTVNDGASTATDSVTINVVMMPVDAGIDAPPVDAPPDAPPVDAPPDAPPIDAPPDAPPIDAPPDAPPIDAPPDAAPDAAMVDAAPMDDAAPMADAAQPTQDGRYPDAPGTGHPPDPTSNDNGCCYARRRRSEPAHAARARDGLPAATPPPAHSRGLGARAPGTGRGAGRRSRRSPRRAGRRSARRRSAVRGGAS